MDLKEQKRIKKQAAKYLSLKNLRQKNRFIELATEDKRRKIKRIINETFTNIFVICFMAIIIFFYAYVFYVNVK